VATLVATYSDSDGVNQNFLSVDIVTAGTTDDPELLVVKCVGGDNAMTVATPTGGGLTYTQQDNYAPAASALVAVWTATETSSQAFTLSTTWAGSASAGHSMTVERWQFATVDPSTPVMVRANSTGSPTASLVTSAPDSGVSWAVGDWNAVDGSGRVYDTSTETPVEELYHFVSGSYTAYHAYLYAPTVRSHALGLTAPGAQKYTLVGIEILDAGGAERLDPLPQAMRFRPPGRVAPNGLWAPFTGRDDPPKRNTAATLGVPVQTAWNSTTTPKSTSTGGPAGDGVLVWGAGDTVVAIGICADSTTTLATPTATGLTFVLDGPIQAAGSSSWGARWVAKPISAGSSVVSTVRGGNANDWGLVAWAASGSDGVGQRFTLASANRLTERIALTDDHSRVVQVIADWGAGSVASLAWSPAGQTQRLALQDGTSYTVYAADWADLGTAAATNFGVTGITPSGANYTAVTVEILGSTQAAGGVAWSADATLTGTASLTAAATLSAAPAASLAATVSGLAGAVLAETSAATLTGTATLTSAATRTAVADASGTATATLTAGAVLAEVATATLTTTATLTAVGTVQTAGVNATAALTATATGTAGATLVATSAAALTTTAGLTAAALGAYTPAAALTGTATLTAAATRTAVAVATLTVTAGLLAGPTLAEVSAATLTVTATRTADAGVGTVATLTVTATLTAAAIRAAVAVATLTGTAALTAAARASYPAAAVLTAAATATTATLMQAQPGATLTLTAAFTAAAGVALAFTIGALSAASRPASALAATAAPRSTLIATTARGGPG
jgi:hypothetical protein